MTGPHPSRIEGDVSALKTVFQAGQTFTTVNWNLWEVLWSMDEDRARNVDLLSIEIGPEHLDQHKLTSAIFRSSGAAYFLTCLSKLSLRTIFGLSQTGNVLLRDIFKCWEQQFGVITDAGTDDWPIATAIWRDALGTFHILSEQDLHLGKRIIRKQSKMTDEALGDWDTDYSALTAVDDPTIIQWTWDRLVTLGAELAQEAGIQNPLVLVTALPDHDDKQEVFSLHNLADFVAFVAGWLEIVKQQEATSSDPPDVVRSHYAEISPLLGIVDGDKWTAPQLRR